MARAGWRIDSRGAGGYIIAAGSVRPGGIYRVSNDAPIVPLPEARNICTGNGGTFVNLLPMSYA